MKNQINQNIGHREIFAAQTLSNAQADINEAMRQIDRAISKMEALYNTALIRQNLQHALDFLSDADDSGTAILTPRIKPSNVVEFPPMNRAEGFDLGLIEG